VLVASKSTESPVVPDSVAIWPNSCGTPQAFLGVGIGAAMVLFAVVGEGKDAKWVGLKACNRSTGWKELRLGLSQAEKIEELRLGLSQAEKIEELRLGLSQAEKIKGLRKRKITAVSDKLSRDHIDILFI